MYSLGVILFEMKRPAFPTVMERLEVIEAIRQQNIVFPCDMLADILRLLHQWICFYCQNSRLNKWLLNHDPEKRPTAKQLQTSDMVRPAKVEADKLQEVLRYGFGNPEIRKKIVAMCLEQKPKTPEDYSKIIRAFFLTPWNQPVGATPMRRQRQREFEVTNLKLIYFF